jgi:hypothetical protein
LQSWGRRETRKQAWEDLVHDQPSGADKDADRTSQRVPKRLPPNGDTPVESTTGTPRWVKVFGIVGLVLLLLIVVLLLTGHGPSRHLHGGLGAQVATVPPSVGDSTALAGQLA